MTRKKRIFKVSFVAFIFISTMQIAFTSEEIPNITELQILQISESGVLDSYFANFRTSGKLKCAQKCGTFSDCRVISVKRILPGEYECKLSTRHAWHEVDTTGSGGAVYQRTDLLELNVPTTLRYIPTTEEETTTQPDIPTTAIVPTTQAVIPTTELSCTSRPPSPTISVDNYGDCSGSCVNIDVTNQSGTDADLLHLRLSGQSDFMQALSDDGDWSNQDLEAGSRIYARRKDSNPEDFFAIELNSGPARCYADIGPGTNTIRIVRL